jgi:hypothetical protein
MLSLVDTLYKLTKITDRPTKEKKEAWKERKEKPSSHFQAYRISNFEDERKC